MTQPLSLDALRERVGDNPLALARLASLLLTKGDAAQARKLAAKVMESAAGNAEAETIALLRAAVCALRPDPGS